MVISGVGRKSGFIVIAATVKIAECMYMARKIVMVAFPDAQMLDVTGPLEVFSSSSRILERQGTADAYTVELVADEAGPLPMSSGIQLVATRAIADCTDSIDTLIVAGGRGVWAAIENESMVDDIRRLAARARRVASVCTGAFLLAQAGLLEERRATTHWASCATLADRFPAIDVEQDSIYVRDGDVYTSAGVTAGMDLALALVEEDHGRDLALLCARWLVKFLKRPGGQSQFSAILHQQQAERVPLRDLQHWLVSNMAADLSVPVLAQRVGMSQRNFARAFAKEVGQTPGRYVESMRIEAARRKLEDTALTVDQVATTCGFGSAETMRRAFWRRVRVSPAAYRARFSTQH